MPFLPTLAVAILLAAASLLCPDPRTAAPRVPAAAPALTSALVPAPPLAAAPAPTPPQASASAEPRLPATLAFAVVYPPVAVEAPRPAGVAQAAPRLAAAARRPCRHCQERVQQQARAQETATPRASDPATARAEIGEDGGPPSAALPFVGTVAETFAPAMRTVRRVAGSAADGAVDLVRGGTASVKGSVAMIAECLP